MSVFALSLISARIGDWLTRPFVMLGNRLDPTGRIARGSVDIGNHGVAWVRRINGNRGACGNSDVRPDCAEAPAAKGRRGLQNVQPHYPCASWQQRTEKAHRQQLS